MALLLWHSWTQETSVDQTTSPSSLLMLVNTASPQCITVYHSISQCTTVYHSIPQYITVNSIVKYDVNFFTNTDWFSEYFCFCAWCARATWSRDVLQNVHSSRKPIQCAPGETHPNWYTPMEEQARLAVTWLELTCKLFIHDFIPHNLGILLTVSCGTSQIYCLHSPTSHKKFSFMKTSTFRDGSLKNQPN